ncbi:hypothetical protein HK104_009293 [Borealophlyctis nickersoniae]|nr:hypothetical protein HK104_009293 [Borealophlyctis nickersoniae]
MLGAECAPGGTVPRGRIDGCRDSQVWKTYYGVHTVWAYLLFRCFIIYKKIYQVLRRKKLRLFEVVSGGGLKPRAADMFILGGTAHIGGRALYTSIILGRGFANHAVEEFFHELPWVTLYIGTLAFCIGIIYATPRHRIILSDAGTSTRARLPSPIVLNLILGTLTFLPLITLNLFAALDGHARDVGDYHLAQRYNAVHYGLWSAYCWALAGVSVYFGVTLVSMLRASQVKEAVNSTEESQSAEFRRAILTLITTLACTTVIELAFAIVLLFYAIFRVAIHSIRGINIWIGTVWIFVTPLMITPIFVVMVWGVYKEKPDKAGSRTASSATHQGSGKGSEIGKMSELGSTVQTKVVTEGNGRGGGA